jgi:hypothetical protein
MEMMARRKGEQVAYLTTRHFCRMSITMKNTSSSVCGLGITYNTIGNISKFRCIPCTYGLVGGMHVACVL